MYLKKISQTWSKEDQVEDEAKCCHPRIAWRTVVVSPMQLLFIHMTTAATASRTWLPSHWISICIHSGSKTRSVGCEHRWWDITVATVIVQHATVAISNINNNKDYLNIFHNSHPPQIIWLKHLYLIWQWLLKFTCINRIPTSTIPHQTVLNKLGPGRVDIFHWVANPSIWIYYLPNPGTNRVSFAYM